MYEEMIESSLVYIENHIDKELSLDQISGAFHMSSYHFSRIFSFLIGVPYKEYLQKRKLSRSLAMLDQKATVLDTALNFGFSHPESYTRAFRQVFGLTPKDYQKGLFDVKPYGIGKVITRDLVNFKGDLLIKSEYVYMEDKTFYGRGVQIRIGTETWMDELEQIGNQFLVETVDDPRFNQKLYYNLAKCMGREDLFQFHFCKESMESLIPEEYEQIPIESGWFAKFHYRDNMKEIYSCFESDIQKWIEKKAEPLRTVGKGMMLIFDTGYPGEFDVLIRLERRLI